MDETEAKALISGEIRVERADVIAAKAFILRESGTTTFKLSTEWARMVTGGEPPKILRLNEGDANATAHQYARYFSAQMAVFQAVWELVAVALLVPASTQIVSRQLHVEFTTGGSSSGFNILDVGVPCLEKFARPKPAPQTILTDGDLYLSGLSEALHPGIKEALRMAVACFRAELFVPAVVMLGAASEGAWIELGLGLAARYPEECKRVARDLDSGVAALRRIIDTITELYKRQDLFASYAKSSGVSLDRLRWIATWSHMVREARNVLHWGVSPSPGNTYESVAVLLMSALQSIGDLDKLRVAVAAP